MAQGLSKSASVQPLTSFIATLVLGIIISQYIIKNEPWKLIILLLSFAIAFFVGYLEIKSLYNKSKTVKSVRGHKIPLTKEEIMANYVAEIFDEKFDEDNIEHDNL